MEQTAAWAPRRLSRYRRSPWSRGEAANGGEIVDVRRCRFFSCEDMGASPVRQQSSPVKQEVLLWERMGMERMENGELTEL
ncbi:hypothetical protein ABZP36_007256 [Zizania latifolia]